jgi:hypothetical protein
VATWASRLCWVTGFGLSIALIALWRSTGPPDAAGQRAAEAPALVEIPDVECGTLPASSDLIHAVNVTVVNRGPRPVRLIGASVGCLGYNCRNIEVRNELVVPVGDKVLIPAKLRIGLPGPFEVPFDVFVDDGTLRTLTARFRGYGVSQ